MTTPRLDYFRDLPGIRRHWNRVIIATPGTYARLKEVGPELLAVYSLINRSCDSEGMATITAREISIRMAEPVRKVLEWIGTLVELQIVNVGITADGACLLIAEWNERAYEAMTREGNESE